MARLESVNVGQPREYDWLDRVVTTAFFKAPTAGRVQVRGVNLIGDEQADRTVHGGPDKAVYAYAAEDIAWWERELGRPLGPGAFGENLTTIGVAVTDAVVGERWRVGGALLEVSEPRTPCFKLGLRMGDPRFPPRFLRAARPGAYLRIVAPGDLGAGDSVELLGQPAHGVTVGLLARAYAGDRALVTDLPDVPQLSASWRAWVAGRQRGA